MVQVANIDLAKILQVHQFAIQPVIIIKFIAPTIQVVHI